ncbi:MAG: hypothetical protein MJ177_06155 [Clostridia bacterium]|nr:hypothetical protein [Clostridia bacterium]
MANCPKCKKKLHIWHISQYCPYCGTNIVFGSFEQQFEKDRRIAEMSVGSFRVFLEKVKKAFISGLVQKMKIAACILPLAGLFIPFGSFSVETAMYGKKITFWALDMVYNAFMGGGYGELGFFSDAPVFASAAAALSNAMIFFAAAALCAVAVLLSELLCFTGNKRSGVSVAVFSVLGIAGTAGAKIFCSSAVKCAEGSQIMSASSNILFLVPILFFAFAAVCGILGIKNPPVYEFKEGDELRADYYKKYKKGEVALMDIPAPICETAEEKAQRENLIKGAYQMEGEGESNG